MFLLFILCSLKIELSALSSLKLLRIFINAAGYLIFSKPFPLSSPPTVFPTYPSFFLSFFIYLSPLSFSLVFSFFLLPLLQSSLFLPSPFLFPCLHITFSSFPSLYSPCGGPLFVLCAQKIPSSFSSSELSHEIPLPLPYITIIRIYIFTKGEEDLCFIFLSVILHIYLFQYSDYSYPRETCEFKKEKANRNSANSKLTSKKTTPMDDLCSVTFLVGPDHLQIKFHDSAEYDLFLQKFESEI